MAGAIPDWLLKYIERGFRVVFFPTKTKAPKDPGWTTRVYTPEDYTEGDNVGVMLGHEVEPGKYLADVDFDWPEGVQFAKRLLPETAFGFGRQSRKVTHCFYTTSKPIVSRKFVDVDGKPFVEIRGAKASGALGFHTMVPPSIHPTGELVQFVVEDFIGHTDILERRAVIYAIACALLQHIGQRGLLHDVRLTVAGFLLQLGLTEDEVIDIGEAVAIASGNNENDVEPTVRGTALRLAQGSRVVGAGGLAKVIGEHGKKIVASIREWVGASDFLRDDKERIVANNEQNITEGIRRLGAIVRYDLFAQKTVVNYSDFNGVINDFARNRIYMDLDKFFHFRPTQEIFDMVLQEIARINRFHPVRAYLENLRWDGTPRVDEWLIHYAGAADTAYVRGISPIVLLAAVRRVREPGCKLDEMLVLESDQGIGKSTALQLLCPDREWFSDDFPLNADSKQVIENTGGKWIIEAAELSGLRSSTSQIEQVKSLLSKQVDGPVRMAYARLPIEQPRQFVVIGTTNSHSYLTDSTGNRRYWPCRVSKFDLEGIKRDRDQLWAEAAARESRGESIRLHPSLYKDAEFQQERRRTEDPWETALVDGYGKNEKYRLWNDDVWVTLHIPIERRDERGQHRVNQIMQRLGFRKMTIRKGDDVKKGWGRDADMVIELFENQ